MGEVNRSRNVSFSIAPSCSAEVLLVTAMSPGIVADWQATAETAGLAAIGLGKQDERVQEWLHACIGLVKSETPQFVQDTLIGHEVVAAGREPVQGHQPRVGAWETQDVLCQFLERRRGPQVARIAIVFVSLATPPSCRRSAKLCERSLKAT
jgi:hypothetical protein